MKETIKKCEIKVALNPYDSEACFLFNYSRKQLKKYLKKNNISKKQLKRILKLNSDNVGITICLDSKIVVSINNYNHTADNYNTLAHEITHVALRTILTRDIPVLIDNQEPLAYLIGYIHGEVINGLIKKGK